MKCKEVLISLLSVTEWNSLFLSPWVLLYLVCYFSAISSVAHWHERWDHHTDPSKYSTWELTVTGTRCLLLNCKKVANDETVNPYGKLSRRLLLPWGLSAARLPQGGKRSPPEPPGFNLPNRKEGSGQQGTGPLVLCAPASWEPVSIALRVARNRLYYPKTVALLAIYNNLESQHSLHLFACSFRKLKR